MRNNTHWPYKPGCQFVSLFSAEIKAAVEDVKIPVEQIMAMTNYTLSIPLKIKDSAIPCELTEVNKDAQSITCQHQYHHFSISAKLHVFLE